MNPYYQYAIAKGYSNADAVMRQSATKISPAIQEQIVKEGIADVYSPPSAPVVGEMPTSNTPIVQEMPTSNTPIVQEMPYTAPITTAIGDTSRPLKEGTTINIFNPNGTTSTSTTAEDVSVDTLTGEIETGTDGVFGGGGGGGGMMGGGEEDGESRMAAPVKTWIPLIVMAAGIAVIILKPFKKKAA